MFECGQFQPQSMVKTTARADQARPGVTLIQSLPRLAASNGCLLSARQLPRPPTSTKAVLQFHRDHRFNVTPQTVTLGVLFDGCKPPSPRGVTLTCDLSGIAEPRMLSLLGVARLYCVPEDARPGPQARMDVPCAWGLSCGHSTLLAQGTESDEQSKAYGDFSRQSAT